MGTPEDSEATRARIIEVAGHLFGEQGWKSVPVRTIASLAKTHLSAVNYHFENKKKLYEAVLDEALRMPPEMASLLTDTVSDPTSARAMLVHIVEGYLYASKDKNEAWKSRLMMREFFDPSPAFKNAIQIAARPLFDRFAELLRIAAVLDSTPPRIELNALLLLLAMDSFASYGAFTKRLLPNLDQSVAGLPLLASEVVDVFIASSLNVVASMPKPSTSKPAKKKSKRS
jgi:TetR/AcrR family transcriptional regulator, regulator of cefoperazone and chloramphenicol sensitivity